MKRKTMALMLALSMCLSLLTACGSGNTTTDDKLPESEDTASSTEQPKESEKPEESEELKEEEPEESREEEPDESAKPTQEEPKEESNAGTEFLALLQEEYQNGFVEGEGPGHTYFDLRSKQSFIDKGVVYIYGTGYSGDSFSFCSYDIASKELHESVSPPITGYSETACYFMDGNFYFMGFLFEDGEDFSRMYDCNGTVLNSFGNLDNFTDYYWLFFEKGILATSMVDGSVLLFSHNFEEIAEVPAPQREIEHGLKEDVPLNINGVFAADGTAYARDSESHLYRFNADTYEWEDMGDVSDFTNQVGSFCGKYVTRSDGIYDRLTGELVFEYGELYPAASEWGHENLCYFGGDKYLGAKDDEYRWVNLKDLSMSDPLPFPDVSKSSLTILDDTYCVYRDKYGWFLWNYNTGEEETIYMFEQ